jgi:hypothetical protein
MFCKILLFFQDSTKQRIGICLIICITNLPKNFGSKNSGNNEKVDSSIYIYIAAAFLLLKFFGRFVMHIIKRFLSFASWNLERTVIFCTTVYFSQVTDLNDIYIYIN